MYKLFFIYVFVIFTPTADAASRKVKKKVLFIGNSVTYFHDMPKTLQIMLDEQKINMTVDQLTYPGASLVDFAKNVEETANKNACRRVSGGETATGVKKILGSRWDYCILQEQNARVLVPEAQLSSFEPSLIYLDSVIKSIKCKTVLFQDYASTRYPYTFSFTRNEMEVVFAFEPQLDEHKNEPMVMASYYYSKNFTNSWDEFLALRAEYDKVAKKVGADVVKVGYAYEIFKKKYPKIQLYEVYAHPSEEGSYLMACLFYRYLTGRHVGNVKYCANVGTKEAKIIRSFADTMK